MPALRRVSYIHVDRVKYDEYKTKETPLARRIELHLELFYRGGVTPMPEQLASIEDLEDTINSDDSITPGEATKLYQKCDLAPHPILVV